MNKKGFTFFSDAVNIIFIIIILIVFSFVMFLIDKTNFTIQEEVVEDLCEEIISIEGDYTILNYLRTPVSNETKEDLGNIKISDVIRQWQNKPSIKPYLLKETENTFGKTYGNCYDLVIGEEVIFGKKGGVSWGCAELPISQEQSISVCISIEKYQNNLLNGKEKECFK